jgi:hypothetical protein
VGLACAFFSFNLKIKSLVGFRFCNEVVVWTNKEAE